MPDNGMPDAGSRTLDRMLAPKSPEGDLYKTSQLPLIIAIDPEGIEYY